MFLHEKHSFLLLTGLFGCACVSDILIPVTPLPTNLVAKIVSDFALKFIQSHTTSIIMMSASSTPEHYLLHKEIIRNFIMLNNASFTYLDYNMQSSGWNAFYLFLIESHEDFVKITSSINRKILRAKPPIFYLIIITSFNDDADELLNNLFEISYEQSIININFLLPHHNQSAWLMTTFMPFIKSCNSLQQHNVALLTEQNYSVHESIDIVYPNKMKDFRQCPVIAAVFHTPPFVIITSDAMQQKYEGIDTRILGQLAKKYNFKLIFRTPSDNLDRGTVWPNGTATGCIKMVVDREANLTIGSFMTSRWRNHYMLASAPYIQVSLGFGILPSEDISTPLEKLLAPFTMHLWQITSFCVVIAGIIIFTTKQISRPRRHFIIGGFLNRSPILNMWNTFLGGSIGNPRFSSARYLQTFARSLFIMWLLFGLILRGSYQGALYDFLQREILSSPYDTIAKINASDCNLMVAAASISSLDVFYFDRNRYRPYNYSQQTVFRKVTDRELSGAVHCNHLQVKYFNLQNSPAVLQMTKDRLYLMAVVIYFTNVSTLKPIFDEEMMDFTDSGLIGFWTREFIDERSPKKNYVQPRPKKLRLQNVSAIFEISAALLAFCCFVFVLEILGIRCEWLRNLIETITY